MKDRLERLGHRAWCMVLACLKDRRGQNLIEHSVLIGVLALAAAFGLSNLSANIRIVLMHVQEVLEQELTPPPPGNGNCGNPNPGTKGGRSPCAP